MTEDYVREKTRLTAQGKCIEDLKQRAYIDSLENPAIKQYFQRQCAVWDKELNEIQTKIEELDHLNGLGPENGLIYLNLLQHAEKLWTMANQELRREILQLVCLNLTFNATSIGVKYNTPFAEMANGVSCLNGRHGRT